MDSKNYIDFENLGEINENIYLYNIISDNSSSEEDSDKSKIISKLEEEIKAIKFENELLRAILKNRENTYMRTELV